MFVLSRKKLETIKISNNIAVTFLELQRNKVRVGIDASKEIFVQRTEKQKQILESPRNVSSVGTAFETNAIVKEEGQSCH